MSTPDSIGEYIRLFTSELGERILQSFPPLCRIEDRFSPLIHNLLRKPFPAQRLAIMGMVKRWKLARAAAVIARNLTDGEDGWIHGDPLYTRDSLTLMGRGRH